MDPILTHPPATQPGPVDSSAGPVLLALPSVTHVHFLLEMIEKTTCQGSQMIDLIYELRKAALAALKTPQPGQNKAAKPTNGSTRVADLVEEIEPVSAG